MTTEYMQPKVVRNVLLLGMKIEANQYTKYLDKRWLNVTHIPANDVVKKLPINIDLLLVARDQLDHSLFYKVRDFYKDRGVPIFTARDGISKIKKEFEDAVFGEDVIDKLTMPDMPYDLKLAYCLTRFHKPGDVIVQKEFRERFADFIELSWVDHPKNSISNFFFKNKRPDRKIFSMCDAKASKYLYHGLQGHYVEQLLAWKLMIPVEQAYPHETPWERENVNEDQTIDVDFSDTTPPEEVVVVQAEPERLILKVEETRLPEKVKVSAGKKILPVLPAEAPAPAVAGKSALEELFFDALHAISNQLQLVSDKVDQLYTDVGLLPKQIAKNETEATRFDLDLVTSQLADVIRQEAETSRLELASREDRLILKLEKRLEASLEHHAELFRLSPMVKRLQGSGQIGTFNALLKAALNMKNVTGVADEVTLQAH